MYLPLDLLPIWPCVGVPYYASIPYSLRRFQNQMTWIPQYASLSNSHWESELRNLVAWSSIEQDGPMCPPSLPDISQLCVLSKFPISSLAPKVLSPWQHSPHPGLSPADLQVVCPELSSVTMCRAILLGTSGRDSFYSPSPMSLISSCPAWAMDQLTWHMSCVPSPVICSE